MKMLNTSQVHTLSPVEMLSYTHTSGDPSLDKKHFPWPCFDSFPTSPTSQSSQSELLHGNMVMLLPSLKPSEVSPGHLEWRPEFSLGPTSPEWPDPWASLTSPPLSLLLQPPWSLLPNSLLPQAFISGVPSARNALSSGPYGLSGLIWMSPPHRGLPGLPICKVAPVNLSLSTLLWSPQHLRLSETVLLIHSLLVHSLTPSPRT